MDSSSDEGASTARGPTLPPTWTVAFGLATLAAGIVGLAKYSELWDGAGGPLTALGPIISIAFGAFAWIVTFPVVWLVARRLRRPKDADPRRRPPA